MTISTWAWATAAAVRDIFRRRCADPPIATSQDEC